MRRNESTQVQSFVNENQAKDFSSSLDDKTKTKNDYTKVDDGSQRIHKVGEL